MNLENPPENKAETIKPKLEYHTVSQRAFEISGEGDYTKILDTLKKEGLFENEINRVRAQYETVLDYAEWMTPDDWEMLTVMDCFDEHTAHHCVATLHIAKERIGSFKAGDKTFSELIINENVSLEDFYRACLFHDIGKCHIPRSILNNKLSDHEFDDQFCIDVLDKGQKNILNEIEQLTGNKFTEDPLRSNDEALHEYLRENHIHTMRYVPAREILNDEETHLVKERFPEIDLETATLAKLIEPHEKESEEILKEHGFQISAEIAGMHHNYRKFNKRFPIGAEVLGVAGALEEILALSDMTQALTARRSYKIALGTPLVLQSLIIEAERHEISTVITSLWVKQELDLIPNDIKNNYNQEEKEAVQSCENFLYKNKSEVDEFIKHVNIATQQHA